MIEIILPGEPVAQARPRVSKKCTYDPNSKQKHAAKFQVLDFLNRSGIEHPFSCPVEIELKFTLRCPKDYENLCKWNLLPCLSRKDSDNMTKFYLDVMTGIVYEDDRQVTDLKISKCYGLEPSTHIYIMPKKETVSEKVKEVLNIIDPRFFTEFVEDVNKLNIRLEMHADHFHLDEKIYHDIAIALCEFSEKYAKPLQSINKKFPEFAQKIKEEKEKIS